MVYHEILLVAMNYWLITSYFNPLGCIGIRGVIIVCALVMMLCLYQCLNSFNIDTVPFDVYRMGFSFFYLSCLVVRGFSFFIVFIHIAWSIMDFFLEWSSIQARPSSTVGNKSPVIQNPCSLNADREKL